MSKLRPLEIDNSGIDPQTNFSANTEFADVLAANLQRRSFLKGTLGTAVATVFGGSLVGCNSSSSPAPVALPAAVQPTPAPVLMGFNAIATNRLDTITVPEGYTAQTFNPWGEPLFNTVPDDTFTTSLKKGDRISEWQRDASNSSDEQLFSVGMHHDGMYYYPLNGSSEHGLLVLNHEYLDQDAMHNALTPRRDADSRYLAEIARKEINGHGISIMEIKLDASGNWHIVRDSKYNRRFTAGHGSEMLIAGPVAAKPSLTETAYTAKHGANKTRGTINNCGNGFTPWGTYLTCEENFNGYFKGPKTPTADQTETIAVAATIAESVAPVQEFTIAAPWIEGSEIDSIFTCEGSKLSPSFDIAGLPEGTQAGSVCHRPVNLVDIFATLNAHEGLESTRIAEQRHPCQHRPQSDLRHGPRCR